MVADHNVVTTHDIVIAVDALRLQCVHDLFDAGEFERITSLEADFFSCQRVDAIVEHQLETLQPVEVARRRAALGSAAARMRLDAADNAPVPRILKGCTLLEHHRHGYRVAEESGVGLAVLIHLSAFIDQTVGCFVAHAQADGRRLELYAVRCFKHQIGKLVGGVVAILILPADDKRGPHDIACKGGAVIAVAQLDQIGDLDVQTLE